MIIINDGKIFENSFKDSIPSDVYYMRLKDPANSFGTNDNLRFSLPNPYDAILFSYPNYFALELKSTKGTSFSFKGSSPMIKPVQIKSLTEAAEYKGVIPGFIFNLREPINKVYFLHINNFNKFISETSKSSMNEKDIVACGGVEIEGKLKKVKYRYLVREFIEKMKNRTENFKS
jgi:penicillin-binding protein-related factor A (putative recombinase)